MKTADAESTIGRAGQLDVLQAGRGIAALLVVLYHATLLANVKLDHMLLGSLFYPFGRRGVDFFFVLSGFIIFYVHRRDVGNSRAVPSYFAKRLIRVFPMYWLVTLAVLPVYAAAPAFGRGNETQLGVVVRSLLLIPQFRSPVVEVGWTLEHELLFYTLFISVLVAPRRWTPVIAAAWAACGCVVALLPLVLKGWDPAKLSPLAGVALSPLNTEFLLGCASGYLASRARATPSAAAALAVGGSILFFGAGLVERQAIADVDLYFVYGPVAAVAILGGCLLERGTRMAVPRWLVALGEASYVVYLTHSTLLSLLTKVVLALGLAVVVGPGVAVFAMVVIAVGTGYVLHVAVERPILALLRARLLPLVSGRQVGRATAAATVPGYVGSPGAVGPES